MQQKGFYNLNTFVNFIVYYR